MNIEEIRGYLLLSAHNPKFYKDFDYVVHNLDLLRQSGGISKEEYVKVHSDLLSKHASTTNTQINSVFSRYMDLVKNGYYNISFTDDQIRSFLVAREVSGKFYSWANLKRHVPGNSYLMKYLTELAKELIELWKGGEERKWDVYSELKGSLVRSLSRGLVSRVDIQTMVKVVTLVMREELKIIKSIPSRGLAKLSSFTSDYEENLIDLDAVVVDITEAYLTNVDTFRELSSKYHSILKDLLRDRKLSNPQYTTYNARLSSVTYGLPSTSEVSLYTPIVEYYYCMSKDPDCSSALVYNREQIVGATELARDFFKTLRNEFLVEEMVFRKLRVDLDQFNHNQKVKHEMWTSLGANLSLLQKYNVITLQQYGDYVDMGREKFL